ncbi:MAG: AAA family ATPase [Chlorobiaceae bacterium]|nr:AAA family ATPase [Chlorobiaceae bacterium]
MDPKQLRIVVSGPVGAGKTTLVRALAERLQVPVVPENMRQIYALLHDYTTIKSSYLSSQEETQRALDHLMEAFFKWADERERIYAGNTGFVADRWEADLLDLWLKLFAEVRCDARTQKLYSMMIDRSRSMSFAITLPPSNFSVESMNEDGLPRKRSFNLTLLSHVVTGGLIRLCPALKVINVNNTTLSVEERLDQIYRIVMNSDSDVRARSK